MSKQTLKIQFKAANLDNPKELGKILLETINEDLAEQAKGFQEQALKDLGLYTAPYPGPIEKSVVWDNNIRVWHSPDYSKLTVSNTSPHAVWVEFGTGVKGANTKNKEHRFAKTRYAPRKGTGWTYMGSDGKYYYTTGMKSRPFMLTTYHMLQTYITKQFSGTGYWDKPVVARLKQWFVARGWRYK